MASLYLDAAVLDTNDHCCLEDDRARGKLDHQLVEEASSRSRPERSGPRRRLAGRGATLSCRRAECQGRGSEATGSLPHHNTPFALESRTGQWLLSGVKGARYAEPGCRPVFRRSGALQGAHRSLPAGWSAGPNASPKAFLSASLLLSFFSKTLS